MSILDPWGDLLGSILSTVLDSSVKIHKLARCQIASRMQNADKHDANYMRPYCTRHCHVVNIMQKICRSQTVLRLLPFLNYPWNALFSTVHLFNDSFLNFWWRMPSTGDKPNQKCRASVTTTDCWKRPISHIFDKSQRITLEAVYL